MKISRQLLYKPVGTFKDPRGEMTTTIQNIRKFCTFRAEVLYVIICKQSSKPATKGTQFKKCALLYDQF